LGTRPSTNKGCPGARKKFLTVRGLLQPRGEVVDPLILQILGATTPYVFLHSTISWGIKTKRGVLKQHPQIEKNRGPFFTTGLHKHLLSYLLNLLGDKNVFEKRKPPPGIIVPIFSGVKTFLMISSFGGVLTHFREHKILGAFWGNTIYNRKGV